MRVQRALGRGDALRGPVRDVNDVRALHGYSVVDGGDIVGIMHRGGEMVRIPAWTVIRDHLILGAHPADTMPPNVEVIANVDSFRFYNVPSTVLYMHFAYADTNVVPDTGELQTAACFLNDLRAAGKTVFIRCRLGLNRSALLTGLVLMDEGYRVKDAIALMRHLRSPHVLENETFERYLLAEDEKRRTRAAAGLHDSAGEHAQERTSTQVRDCRHHDCRARSPGRNHRGP